MRRGPEPERAGVVAAVPRDAAQTPPARAVAPVTDAGQRAKGTRIIDGKKTTVVASREPARRGSGGPSPQGTLPRDAVTPAVTARVTRQEATPGVRQVAAEIQQARGQVERAHDTGDAAKVRSAERRLGQLVRRDPDNPMARLVLAEDHVNATRESVNDALLGNGDVAAARAAHAAAQREVRKVEREVKGQAPERTSEQIRRDEPGNQARQAQDAPRDSVIKGTRTVVTQGPGRGAIKRAVIKRPGDG